MISDDFFNIEINIKRIYSQIYAQKFQTTPHVFDDVQDNVQPFEVLFS